MEANRVMSDEHMDFVLGFFVPKDGRSFSITINDLGKLKEAQAEISYKAGYEQAFKEMLALPEDMKVYKSENIVDEESFKAGIKTVVGWLSTSGTDFLIDYLERSPIWQKQLKDWGIG